MKLFDVYPLFDVNIVKGKAATYGTTKVRNTLTSMEDMPLSPSVTHILTMWTPSANK